MYKPFKIILVFKTFCLFLWSILKTIKKNIMKPIKKITLKDAVIALAVTTWAIGMVVLIYKSITDGLY
jgi:hypothetical protein